MTGKMIENSDAQLSAVIGLNVRRLRREASLSLDALSERATVSKGMLAQIEKGSTNPSIGTLCKIANAFGITLQSLLAESNAARIEKVSLSDVANLWAGESDGTAKLLFGLDLRNLIELWKWSIPKGSIHQSEAHPVGTKEAVLVLRGVLTLGVGDKEEVVKSNQAILFDADLAHSYSNQHAGACEFVLLVVEPRTPA